MGCAGCIGWLTVVLGFFFWPLWILSAICFYAEYQDAQAKRLRRIAEMQVPPMPPPPVVTNHFACPQCGAVNQLGANKCFNCPQEFIYRR